MFEYVRHIDGMAQASSYHKPIMNQHEPTTLNIFEHHMLVLYPIMVLSAPSNSLSPAFFPTSGSPGRAT